MYSVLKQTILDVQITHKANNRTGQEKKSIEKNRCQNFALSDLGDVETGKEYKPRESYRPRKNTDKQNSYEQLHF